MQAFQTKRMCVHCGNVGHPKLSVDASVFGWVFWVLLVVSFFIPALFFVTGLHFLWMVSTKQVVCQFCNKALLTAEQVRATYTSKNKEGNQGPSSSNEKREDEKPGYNHEARSNHSQQRTEQARSARVFSCPSCHHKIRVPLPLPKGIGKCVNCQEGFKVSSDDDGNLYIYSINNNQNDNYERALTLDDSFSVLQVNKTATAQVIKAAYRKRMLEYHPDKVSKLGEELQQLAERKAKQINAAYALLEKNGHLE